MIRERADKIFDDYVSNGKIEKENRRGFTKALLDAAEKKRSELEKLISKQVRETLETLKLPMREDLQRLEQKVDELLGSES